MRRVAPVASCSLRVTTPPALKPFGSVPFSPVLVLGKPVEVIRSFSPKKSLKPRPALLDGVVGSSPMATPSPDVAWIDRAPLPKLAVAWPPSWVFKVLRKVAGVKLAGVADEPLIVMVPAPKSMSTCCCTTPFWSTTATEVLPVKPEMAVGRSRPVSRPVRVLGGGTAVEALCARLIWSTAWLTYWSSWDEIDGSCWLRMASRPCSVPLPAVSSRAAPPGWVTCSWPAVAPELE